MGACGSKAQAMASDAGNRVSRAFPKNGKGGALAAAGADGDYDPPAKPKKGKKGKQQQQRYEDTVEYKLGLPEDLDARQKGCYLVFDPASGGALHYMWSTTAVEGAWGFFFPRQTVAEFNFRGGGRTEIIRGLQTNKKKLFSGLTQFFKLAYDKDGVIQMFNGDQADYWYMTAEESCEQIELSQLYEARIMQVVAVIPRHSAVYKGIRKTNAEIFTDNGTRSGGVCWKPLR